MNHTIYKTKYWQLAYADETECRVGADGLLFMFQYEDVESILDKYPHDSEGWFFNESRDRYIAERHEKGLITVNPRFVYKNFKCVTT